MSAVDQGSPATASGTDNAPGPVEIVFETTSAPKELTAPKADVSDVVPKADKSTTDESTDSVNKDEQVEDRDSKGRFKPGVQTRIDELTRSRREAEREAAYWKARVQGTDSAQSPAQTAAQPKPPVQTDYATPEEYQEALDDFKIDQKVEAKLAAKESEKTVTEAVTKRAMDWQSRLADARESIPDFDEVVNAAEIPVAGHVAELLVEHDLGAALMHHLAKNPEVLEKMNNMSPAKAAFEIGKLSTVLEAAAPGSGTDISSVTETKPSVTQKVVERSVSKAPPPSQTIGQGRATTPALDDLGMEDYVARRKTQGAGWAR